MKMGRFISLIAGIVVAITCSTISGSMEHTKGITVNNSLVNFPADKKPIIVNEVTYVPLYFFAETLGFTAEDYHDYINIGGGDVVRYSVQNDLLKDAMDYIGVATPQKAVEVWSEGLKKRSAALQYSVMTKELKDVYAKDLERSFPNWVTGMSSPWVSGYQIVSEGKGDSETRVFNIRYTTATSAGEWEPFNITLKIVKDGEFWRVSKVQGDEEARAYTGFL